MTGARRWLPVAAAMALGCAGDHRICAPPDAARLARLPDRLSQTGLFAEGEGRQIASDARPYTPAFELWSDGASKRRWIHLPAGTRIDSSDMNAWQFPQGTRLWKEFTRNGVRVETRLYAKVGPAPEDWAAAAYVWAPDQREASLTPGGAMNALGTEHDVPGASHCPACHDGTASRILGFSAVQLDHPAPAGQLDLDDLIADGMLTAPPPAKRPAIPGDDKERATLGWLHANCGTCHNPARPARPEPRCYDPQSRVDLSLRAGALDRPRDVGVYRTAINFFYIRPGRAAESPLFIRLSSRHPEGWGMPPLASERIDPVAVEQVRAWIDGLAER
jgi:hypothetical protein